jgi:hypothetical protein
LTTVIPVKPVNWCITKLVTDDVNWQEELLHLYRGWKQITPTGFHRWHKVRILRSHPYVPKCLGSTQWSVKVTTAAIRQLSYLPLLPLAIVSIAHTSVQHKHCAFSSLVVHLASWVVALHLTDRQLAYSTARGNSSGTHHVYQEQHPWRHLPHHTTFAPTVLRIWDPGTLQVR